MSNRKGDSIGVGLTHYPPLAGNDKSMANLLRYTLTDPDIPRALTRPDNWPARMRAEWGDDEGVTAAGAHRQALVENFACVREAVDEFQPDLLVVWGDDQYENFREEVVPPFCVLAYDDLTVQPFHLLAERCISNAWGLPEDMRYTLRGDAAAARDLANALIDQSFDMAYSYRKRSDINFPHSIMNTQTFLDYENAGQRLPYPVVGMTVNCYGPHVIARRGGLSRFADIPTERLDPGGPKPTRCFALGQATARAFRSSGKRVAYVASSSWSHAFLNDKEWHLRPDTAADEQLYAAMLTGDMTTWMSRTSAEIVASGQHEILNWYADELGLGLRWSSFVPTDIFNSNKAFALFGDRP
jgi:hypothetical protein